MESFWVTGGLAVLVALLLIALVVVVSAQMSAKDEVDTLNADLSQANSDLAETETQVAELEGQLSDFEGEAEAQLADYQDRLSEANAAVQEATAERGEALAFDDRRDGDDRQVDAFEICKDFIAPELDSPDTASYPDPYEDDGEVTVVLLPDIDYRVSSQLDSENDAGASVRTYFVCRVDYIGNDEWRLVDLVLA